MLDRLPLQPLVCCGVLTVLVATDASLWRGRGDTPSSDVDAAGLADGAENEP